MDPWPGYEMVNLSDVRQCPVCLALVIDQEGHTRMAHPEQLMEAPRTRRVPIDVCRGCGEVLFPHSALRRGSSDECVNCVKP